MQLPVLLFDFQAHGESTGEHITFGYLERDAQAAIDFLRRAPDEKVGVLASPWAVLLLCLLRHR